MNQLIPQLAADVNKTKLELFKSLHASTRPHSAARALTPLKSLNSPARVLSPSTPKSRNNSNSNSSSNSYFQKFKTPTIKLSPTKKSHFNDDTIDPDDLVCAFNPLQSFFNNQSGELADWNKENDFSTFKFNDLNVTENVLTSSRLHVNANVNNMTTKPTGDENCFTSSNETHAKFELSLNESKRKIGLLIYFLFLSM